MEHAPSIRAKRELDSGLPSWRDLVHNPPPGSHILQIYEERNHEIEAATLFVAEGLRRGERVCCVGSPRDLDAIRGALEASRVDVDRLIRDRTLVLVDQLNLNGGSKSRDETSSPSLEEFIQEVFEGVPNEYSGVRWWGSRIAGFFEEGQFDESIAFERLCHEKREALPWSLLCAYNARKLVPERHATAFWDVLRNHSHLIPAGELGLALELFPTGEDL